MLIKKGNKGEKSIWECDTCKKHFEVKNGKVKESKLKFCSKECRLEESRKQDYKRVVGWVKDFGSSAFRGGLFCRILQRYNSQVRALRT